MASVFVVVVAGNLVNAIEWREAQPQEPAPGTSLEVGTRLATTFKETGRIDGIYAFESREGARAFAGLCLQFIKGLVVQRIQAIEALPIGFGVYRSDHQAQGPDVG